MKKVWLLLVSVSSSGMLAKVLNRRAVIFVGWTGKPTSALLKESLYVSRQCLSKEQASLFKCCFLAIPDPPQLLNNSSEQTAEIGDKVSMWCSWDSNPPPAIVWKKEGSDDVLTDGAKITLLNVTQDDAGIYVCYASAGKVPTCVELQQNSNICVYIGLHAAHTCFYPPSGWQQYGKSDLQRPWAANSFQRSSTVFYIGRWRPTRLHFEESPWHHFSGKMELNEVQCLVSIRQNDERVLKGCLQN